MRNSFRGLMKKATSSSIKNSSGCTQKRMFNCSNKNNSILSSISSSSSITVFKAIGSRNNNNNIQNLIPMMMVSMDNNYLFCKKQYSKHVVIVN
ncbi:hypothetical protein ABK040_016646 [Willaertia magna]